MTGKALYDKHCTAAKASERSVWNSAEQRYHRVWPTAVPMAWQFVSDDMRRYYNELAKLVTPRRVKR